MKASTHIVIYKIKSKTSLYGYPLSHSLDKYMKLFVSHLVWDSLASDNADLQPTFPLPRVVSERGPWTDIKISVLLYLTLGPLGESATEGVYIAKPQSLGITGELLSPPWKDSLSCPQWSVLQRTHWEPVYLRDVYLELYYGMLIIVTFYNSLHRPKHIQMTAPWHSLVTETTKQPQSNKSSWDDLGADTGKLHLYHIRPTYHT